MQTFLPYPDFVASAEVLDDRRLGKQRVETFQVLRALTWPTYGWKNHPATRMWRGFLPALVAYGLATCDAWERRGHADGTRASLLEFTGGRVPHWHDLHRQGQLPPWLGLDAFHVSHRSALVRKDPAFYRERFPDVPDDLPYVWPTATFPRWPLRRAGHEPLPLAAAVALLGHERARDEQAAAVAAVVSGCDRELRLPAGGGATTAGLLAGLCTPGMTLWVTPGDPLSPTATAPCGEALPPRATAKTSPSVARAPTERDARAMSEEALAIPEFRFCPAGQHLEPTQIDDIGLVVLDDGVERTTVAGLPDVPVLSLRRDPA